MAKFDMFTSMAMFVGKTLKIRPTTILSEWGVAELVVTYGQYTNELADRNFEEYEATHGRKKPDKQPPKYHVQFIGVQELEEE